MGVKRGYKQTEAGVIPEDWLNPKLCQITEEGSPICYGIVQVGPFAASGIPVLAIKNLNLDYSTNIHRAAIERERPYVRSRVRPGDVVISVKGTTGRVGIIPAHFSGNISRDLARIRPRKEISPNFVHQMLQSDLAQRRLEAAAVGTTRKELSIAILKQIRIPLPPAKAEQEAIAEVLSDADALIESLEQLIAKKRQLKQGAMQELLTGKTRLPGFSGQWQERLFGEIAQPRGERIDPRRLASHKFCIELEHIEQETGGLVGHTTTSEGSSLKTVFQKDDVLFGKLRAYLRKYWLADRNGACSTEIWALKANQSLVIPQFLLQIVASERFIEAASSAYGTHMPRSDWNVVKNYGVRLPLVAEQTAIGAILADMDAEAARLEAKLSKARQIKQGMMQELLTGRIRLV